MTQNVPSEEEQLRRATLKFSSKVFGLMLGLGFGLVIFLATNWLVLKGGPVGPDGEEVVGPHLGLLGNFFIGYSVTFVGSLVGFGYGFALGTITGALIGRIYNTLAKLAG